MVCHGGFSLDESVRRTWYDPETILKRAGLRKGIVFVDVGCGDGFFALLAASIVGARGKVFAVDSDSAAIDKVERKSSEQQFKNIQTQLGTAEETVFCNHCADIVFYSMVLHDFNDPIKVLGNAKKMLKPSGILVNLDWKKLQMSFGPPFKIRFSEKDAVELITRGGFSVETVKEAGLYHYVVHAKPYQL